MTKMVRMPNELAARLQRITDELNAAVSPERELTMQDTMRILGQGGLFGAVVIKADTKKAGRRRILNIDEDIRL